MKSLTRIEALLADLERLGQLRLPEDGQLRGLVGSCALALGVPFVDLSSNDYLGLAGGGLVLGDASAEGGDGCGGAGAVRGEARGVSRETSLLAGTEGGSGGWGSLGTRVGAGASRLLGGTYPEHMELEAEVARWVGQPDALLFSTGYAANVGLLSCLPQPEDVVFSDGLNHASIIDGCRLSKARVEVYAHRDLQVLERMLRETPCLGQKWVVSESYFSMDGDSPDLPGLRGLCDRFGAGLVLDEAHALGVFGPGGAGLAAHCGVVPDVCVGAFGKAIGLQGAFVAGPTLLKRWLWNRARSFVFSTAPMPGLAAQLLFHVKQIQLAEPKRRRLQCVAERFRTELHRRGLAVTQDSFGPIVPLMIGDSRLALQWAAQLRARGILAYPVRPPTVPEGTARLRLTVTTAITEAALNHVLQALDDLMHADPPPQAPLSTP